MRAVFQGKRITLDESKALGDGGEATVFAVEVGKTSLAAKLYHAPSAERARKVAALVALAARLPPAVVGPLGPAPRHPGLDRGGLRDGPPPRRL